MISGTLKLRSYHIVYQIFLVLIWLVGLDRNSILSVDYVYTIGVLSLKIRPQYLVPESVSRR